jgi:hypothetical protein
MTVAVGEIISNGVLFDLKNWGKVSVFNSEDLRDTVKRLLINSSYLLKSDSLSETLRARNRVKVIAPKIQAKIQHLYTSKNRFGLSSNEDN